MVKLPVCFESRTTAASFRKLLDKKEFNYKRTTGSRTYTKVSFVIAHEKSAMVYKYDIENSKIKADIWEENPSSGNITYIEIESEEKKLIALQRSIEEDKQIISLIQVRDESAAA